MEPTGRTPRGPARLPAVLDRLDRVAILSAVHVTLAAAIGVILVLALFGQDSVAHASAGDTGDILFMGGATGPLLIGLPMLGIVLLGMIDWQSGRGPGIMRAADIAWFALAALELSAGTAGFVRGLLGLVAVLAAAGVAGSIVVTPPRRAGFRR